MSDDHKKLIATTLAVWVLAAVYALSPIDLVPDFFPFAGWLDDVLGVGTALGLTIHTLTSLHRDGFRIGSKSGEPTLRGRTPQRETIDVEAYEPMPVDELRSL
jgi:uncharacterized membrane protein YkvA (DUF1232 family)